MKKPIENAACPENLQITESKSRFNAVLDFVKRWSPRVTILLTLGGAAAMEASGCAATPDRPPTGKMDETTKAVMEILKEHGFEYIGTQTDRSVIKYAESTNPNPNKAKKEAEKMAKEKISSALGGSDAIFEDPWFKRTPRGWVAVVHGRKGKLIKPKKGKPDVTTAVMGLLKKHGFEYAGAQADKSVIKYAESTNPDPNKARKEAEERAKDKIRSALGDAAISFGDPWLEETSRGWVAVVKGRKMTAEEEDKEYKKTRDALDDGIEKLRDRIKKLDELEKKLSAKDLADFYAKSNKSKSESAPTVREGVNIPKEFTHIDQECIDYYVGEFEKGPFYSCLSKAFKKDPDRNRSGTLEVSVKVNNQGKVWKVTIMMKTKGVLPKENKKIRKCVIRGIKSWPLPKKPKGVRDIREFSFPLVFSF